MSWAAFAKEALGKGETVQIKPRGHSMKGKVNDGDLVTIAPCDPISLGVGDIVLLRIRGKDYLHLVKAIDKDRFQIGNNRGGINGWVGAHSIYGKATQVEDRLIGKAIVSTTPDAPHESANSERPPVTNNEP